MPYSVQPTGIFRYHALTAQNHPWYQKHPSYSTMWLHSGLSAWCKSSVHTFFVFFGMNYHSRAGNNHMRTMLWIKEWSQFHHALSLPPDVQLLPMPVTWESLAIFCTTMFFAATSGQSLEGPPHENGEYSDNFNSSRRERLLQIIISDRNLSYSSWGSFFLI